MSLDDYGNYLAQKFTIAVAIAILKTVPEAQTLQNYIEYLKQSINDENMDSNLNITICSDDFDMFDDHHDSGDIALNNDNDTIENGDMNDSVTILDDYQMDNENTEVSSLLNVFKQRNDGRAENLAQSRNVSILKHDVAESYNNDVAYYQINAYSSDSSPKAALYSEKHRNLDPNALVQDNSNCTNSTMLNKLDNNNLQTVNNSKIRAIISKNIDKEFGNAHEAGYENGNHYMIIDGTAYKSGADKTFESVDTNKPITESNALIDLQDTNKNDDLYMIVVDIASKSIADKGIVSNKSIIKCNALMDAQKTQGFTDHKTNVNHSQSAMVIPNTNLYMIAGVTTKSKAYSDSNKVDFNFKSIKPINISNTFDSQETQCYTANTHISQSQVAMNVSKNYIYGVKDNITANITDFGNEAVEFETNLVSKEDNRNTSNIEHNAVNVNAKTKDIDRDVINIATETNLDSKDYRKLIDVERNAVNFISTTEKDGNIIHIALETNSVNKDDRKPSNIEHNAIDFNATTKDIDRDVINIALETNSVNKDYRKLIDIEHNAIDFNATTKDVDINIDATQSETPNINITQEYNDVYEDTEISDLTTSQKELIPFKVIEELNKIKGFLRKTSRRVSSDGFSSDSGYRSDSQSRSRNALQLSGAASNQSAHCLYTFLINCPLVVRTRDFSTEISKVLGQLIDSFHKEEKYPPFLEELLEYIDVSIKRIYDEDTNSEYQLLTKDEFVQRILLLNQSIHIQKFTIDKIANILQEFLDEMMKNDENFEIKNIVRIENLTYLYHLLEIIVKRYLKSKDNLSQSTVLSVEEVNLKKSTLTDIWRKKWNSNYKSCSNEGSYEKCVLAKCSEVLNKLIVTSVDNFSLIAYASLQCFNSIQN